MSSKMRNLDWDLSFTPRKDGSVAAASMDRITAALLMDIRQELRDLNAKLAGVGPTTHAIERNTRTLRDRTCQQCGAGPYTTARGLNQHRRLRHR
jgi:hypothetical protein